MLKSKIATEVIYSAKVGCFWLLLVLLLSHLFQPNRLIKSSNYIHPTTVTVA